MGAPSQLLVFLVEEALEKQDDHIHFRPISIISGHPLTTQ